MKSKLFHFTKISTIFIITTIILSGCFEKEDGNKGAANQQRPAPTVSTVKVQPLDVPIKLEYPAKVKSVNQVQITAKVAGTLEKKYFKEGTFVKKGDLLYTIDDARYDAAVSAAKAQVGVAEATLDEATKTYNRMQNLLKSESISQSENDTATSTYLSAKATLAAAKADVKSAQVDLDYTKIKAPISGIIGLSQQDIGSFVGSSSDNVLLTTITQVDPVYVEFSLPDIEILKKRYIVKDDSWKNIANANLPVSIKTSDGSEYGQKGKLDFLDTIVDSTTSTVKARATFENKDNILIPGLFVHITIEGLTQKDAITIPQVSLLQDGTGTFVYGITDGKVVKKPVKTGMAVGDKFIIESGLNNGDVVITSHINKIRPGMPVNTASN